MAAVLTLLLFFLKNVDIVDRPVHKKKNSSSFIFIHVTLFNSKIKLLFKVSMSNKKPYK